MTSPSECLSALEDLRWWCYLIEALVLILGGIAGGLVTSWRYEIRWRRALAIGRSREEHLGKGSPGDQDWGQW